MFLPNEIQGELIVLVGVVGKVKSFARKGPKGKDDKPTSIDCVSVELLAMGSAPLEVKVDELEYNSTTVNPLASQLSGLVKDSAVMVVGRRRTVGGYTFFEPSFIHTDEKAFQYLGAICGVQARK